jgi:hypothetical protein
LPSVSLTEDTYRNADLGILWLRPDQDWELIDTSGATEMFGDLTPLVTLAREMPEQYVTLLTIDLPRSEVQPLAELMQSDPEQGLAELAVGLGDAAEQAELTQIGSTNAVLVPLALEEGSTNFMWIVVQPQGVIYALAEGFEDVETAAATLAMLTLTTEQAMADLTAEEQRARLIAQVEKLRGLQTKATVTVEFLDRDDLRAVLEAKASEEMDAAETDAVAQMLKLLGLIPADADLLQLMFDLQESQVLGFYDPPSDTFYLVDTARDEPMDALDQATFVHEYVHALQDQYFDLSRITDNVDISEDERGALQSLAEGDATLLMALWAASNLSPDQLEQIVAQASELDPEVLARTPPYLQQALTFPYEYGTGFAQSIVAALGWEALDAIWRKPPTSTEQIMHPERYGDDEPIGVTLAPDLADALGPGWSEALRDVWGEADLLLLLRDTLGDDAFAAADGWGGSQYVFLTDSAGRDLFAIEIAWDSAAEANEGGVGIARWLEASGFAGQGVNFTASDGRSAFLKTTGQRVYLAMGREQADVQALLAGLKW